MFRQKKELQEMNEKIRYMQEEVHWMENEKKAILTDSSVMERYAREKYFMKTPNEEVYVFDTISSTTSQSVKNTNNHSQESPRKTINSSNLFPPVCF
ncbi:MAG: hypothetical protein HWD58_01595 [Bacteroidota bacterium]|nr:MAG: hypothetical protein HWD58_01595 [Bacteroidota bacterium]